MSYGLSYAVEQRLRFIDFLLHQYGRVNRSAIEDYFGMTKLTATNDLRLYLELAPNNVIYDPRLKTYLTSPDFERIWP